jgi:pantetheine-phosphate adenylyltransferase
MKTVIYPGSFDPFTNGHLDLVERARCLFDKVVVAVAVNSGKNPLFTLEERRELIVESCAGMPNVEVIAFEGLLVDAVKQLNADAILRGLRAFSDFEYELQMALMNRELLKGCETSFLTAQLDNSYGCSTLVNEVALLDADSTAHLPAPVTRALMQRRKSL